MVGGKEKNPTSVAWVAMEVRVPSLLWGLLYAVDAVGKKKREKKEQEEGKRKRRKKMKWKDL